MRSATPPPGGIRITSTIAPRLTDRFHERLEEQKGHSHIRLQSSDLRLFSSVKEENVFLVLRDESVYISHDFILVPLVDQGMQDRTRKSFVGSAWRRVPSSQRPVLNDSRVSDAIQVNAGTRDDSVVNTEPFDVPCDVCVQTADGGLFEQIGIVPSNFDAHKNYLKHAERFFCLDTGRGWMDCDTREIDHIYNCQKFTYHDKFFCYAFRGGFYFEWGRRIVTR